MKNPRYINLSIPIEAHGKLKRLAKAKRLSMAGYMSAMVQFFANSGRDPEDIAPANSGAELAKLKTRMEQIPKLIKAQEKQVHQPVAEAVFGMEKTILETSSASKLLILLQSELKCPRCEASFTHFQQTESYFSCRSCELKIGVQIGQYSLTFPDLVTLLSGGMTRVLENVEIPGLGTKTGRFFISPENHELQLYEY